MSKVPNCVFTLYHPIPLHRVEIAVTDVGIDGTTVKIGIGATPTVLRQELVDRAQGSGAESRQSSGKKS